MLPLVCRAARSRRQHRHAMLLSVTVSVLGALILVGPAWGQTVVTAELLSGAPLNVPTHLVIHQSSAPEIHITARYHTRPLDAPLYYVLRLVFGERIQSWELQLIHQKLYLSNRPPEVQHLEITHGFNLITANYARGCGLWTVRFGAGLVLPHVAAQVRGRDLSSRGGIFGTGYRLTGPAFAIGAGRRWRLSQRFTLSIEAQGTAAWARVKLHDGSLSTVNVALHGLVGVGYAVGD